MEGEKIHTQKKTKQYCKTTRTVREWLGVWEGEGRNGRSSNKRINR